MWMKMAGSRKPAAWAAHTAKGEGILPDSATDSRNCRNTNIYWDANNQLGVWEPRHLSTAEEEKEQIVVNGS